MTTIAACVTRLTKIYSDATSRSPTIITLRATDGETTTVHKELLIFFSKYFKAALEDPFAESTQITLGVDLSGLNLHRFKIWLYTGEIADPKHQEGICECANHVLLYIFADMMDILALRRKVMDYITLRAPLLPEYDTVRIIFTNLPATSPLRKHTLRTYIAHWEAGVDGKDEYAKAVSNDTEGVLKGFMEEFQRGVARRATDHDVDSTEDCACCGDACRYHEHESHAEWSQSMFLSRRVCSLDVND
jgi:hypothetical protein